jgi:hypothetical protein
MPSNKPEYLKKKINFLKDSIKKKVNPYVFFDENRECFKIDTGDERFKTAKGLVPTLRKIFYDKYKYEPSKYPNKKKKIKKDVYGGQVRGCIVHKQLMMYANEYSLEEFKEQYLNIHPYTIEAFKFLKKIKNWIPIRAEVAVGDPELMMATSIDMICMNQKGETILIEWKTGMDNYILKGTEPFNGPLKENNCPLNQAYLQLLFGKIMLEKNHGIKSDKEYVVQIIENDVIPYQLPKEYIQKKHVLYNYLLSCLDKNARIKNKNKSKYF